MRYTNEEITQIYKRQIDTVYRVCYLFFRANKADIEDAVQTVFLQLIRKGKIFENERHERAWMIVTASNICKNILASAWKTRVTTVEQEESLSTEAAADETLISVMELPDRYKTAIYMFYYEGYSAQEIADEMGKSVNSVWGYLHQGRKLLKNILQEVEQ